MMTSGESMLRTDAVENRDGRHRPRLVLVGWDGATPELLERFMAKGVLPTVARGRANGCYRRLRSTIPPVTACAWCSFLSGKNPGKHGLFDFVTPRAGSYLFDYTNGGFRRDRQNDLLRQLNDLGLRVGCVNVPMTYPPYPIDGFMISGLDAPDEKSGMAIPADIFEAVQREVGRYRIDNRHLGSMRTDDDRRSALEEFKRIESRRTEVTLGMMQRCPVDVLIIIYNATDQVQHHFWHLMDATHPAHRPGSAEVAAFAGAIEEIYAHCDAELSRLLAHCDGANWMLVSDHGAGPTCGPRVRLNNALAQAGLLAWSDRTLGLTARAAGWLDGVLRRTLSTKQKAFLTRVLPGGRSRMEAMSLPPIDWSRTTAFAYEGFTLSPCVWINRKDRFPLGTVSGGAEYDDACDRSIRALTALRDPQTNAPVIPKVYRSSEVYHGDHAHGAPDLILDWWTGATFTITKSHPQAQRESAVMDTLRSITSGQDISGIHRRDGVFVGCGPVIASRDGEQLGAADLVDIAPTVLALMGQPTPPDMDGRAMLDVAAGSITTAPLTRPSAARSNPDDDTAASAGYSDREREIIEQRLSNLGYLE